jgi:hypothetical protein
MRRRDEAAAGHFRETIAAPPAPGMVRMSGADFFGE